MTGQRIVIIGGGGHAAVVIEALRAMGTFSIVGIVDPHAAYPDVLGVSVLGGDDRLPLLRREGVQMAVVALGNNRRREAMGETLINQGYTLPIVVHPGAAISPSATMGDGTVVMNRAVVGTRAQVGPLVIINTGAVVEHDNCIGAAAHIAPLVALAGSVVVGARSLVGVGSAVRPGIRIGADAVVGAGSAVVADVPDGSTVGGSPARRLGGAKTRA